MLRTVGMTEFVAISISVLYSVWAEMFLMYQEGQRTVPKDLRAKTKEKGKDHRAYRAYIAPIPLLSPALHYLS